MNLLTQISLGKEVASTRYPVKASLIEYDENKWAWKCETDKGIFIQTPDGAFLNDTPIEGDAVDTYLTAMSTLGIDFKEVDGELIYETENKDYRMTVSEDGTNVLYEIDGRSMLIDYITGLVHINHHTHKEVLVVGEDITHAEYVTLLFRWADDLTPPTH